MKFSAIRKVLKGLHFLTPRVSDSEYWQGGGKSQESGLVMTELEREREREREREDHCVSTNSNNTEDSGVSSFSGSVSRGEGGEVTVTNNKEITTKQRRAKFPDIGVTNYTDGKEIISTCFPPPITERWWGGRKLLVSRQDNIKY